MAIPDRVTRHGATAADGDGRNRRQRRKGCFGSLQMLIRVGFLISFVLTIFPLLFLHSTLSRTQVTSHMHPNANAHANAQANGNRRHAPAESPRSLSQPSPTGHNHHTNPLGATASKAQDASPLKRTSIARVIPRDRSNEDQQDMLSKSVTPNDLLKLRNDSGCEVYSNSSSNSSSGGRHDTGTDTDASAADRPLHPNSTDASRLPTGLVVTLLAAPKQRHLHSHSFLLACSNIPNQLTYFVEPQGMDMLIVVGDDGGVDDLWTVQGFANCMGLQERKTSSRASAADEAQSLQRTWTNIDGSTMSATAYGLDGFRSTVWMTLSEMAYPQYILRNVTLMSDPIEPKHCQAPSEYIQSTSWYARQMLELGILQDYDYFLKVDNDIIFIAPVPFYILQDMHMKGAYFGHSAEYFPAGSGTCGLGIMAATADFLDDWSEGKRFHIPSSHQAHAVARERSRSAQTQQKWKGKFCSPTKDFDRNTDLFYTNFIIGRVSFWQSPMVLQLSNYLSEYPKGYFKHRWTDQIFWHRAMGMLLYDYRSFLADYTRLRCMPNPTCWLSSILRKKYGENSTHRCDSGGMFLHPKDFMVDKAMFAPPPASPRTEHLLWDDNQVLFTKTYTHNCKGPTV